MLRFEIFNTGGTRLITDKCTNVSGDTPTCYSSGINVEDIQLIEAYEGDEAYRKYWQFKFNEMSDENRELLLAVMPNIVERAQTENLNMPDKLYKIALGRLIRLEDKFMSICPRCGGSGIHSFTPRYGNTCFKCGGYKYVLPKRTKKWLKSVEEYFKQQN